MQLQELVPETLQIRELRDVLSGHGIPERVDPALYVFAHLEIVQPDPVFLIHRHLDTKTGEEIMCIFQDLNDRSETVSHLEFRGYTVYRNPAELLAEFPRFADDAGRVFTHLRRTFGPEAGAAGADAAAEKRMCSLTS